MKRKFYRGKLATIVWNPTAGKPLATFVNNQFTTENNEVANVLLSKGYHEVSLKAQRPPVLPEDPVQEIGDVKVMGGGMSEAVALANLKEAQEQKEANKAPAKKEKEWEKDNITQPRESVINKPKKTIKRRDK